MFPFSLICVAAARLVAEKTKENYRRKITEKNLFFFFFPFLGIHTPVDFLYKESNLVSDSDWSRHASRGAEFTIILRSPSTIGPQGFPSNLHLNTVRCSGSSVFACNYSFSKWLKAFSSLEFIRSHMATFFHQRV